MTGVPVAQWLEHLTGVTEVVGSIPAWDSDFFSVVLSPVAKQLAYSKTKVSTKHSTLFPRTRRKRCEIGVNTWRVTFHPNEEEAGWPSGCCAK